jgi:proteasome alpha subunit
MKPLEVEILVAEVGARPGDDQMFHILYDGTVMDEDRFTALGGEADTISGRMDRAYQADWSLAEALAAAAHALSGPDRRLQPHELEVAVLDRGTARRAFRRVLEPEVAALLSGSAPGGQAEGGKPVPAPDEAAVAAAEGGTAEPAL